MKILYKNSPFKKSPGVKVRNKNWLKKAQETVGMSFGMIFSILLMIVFIVVAFIAIRAFITTSQCAKIGIFIDDFQTKVNQAWNSQKSSFEFRGVVPTKIEYVCFANLSQESRGEFKEIMDDYGFYGGNNENFFFYPQGEACKMAYYPIKHLNIEFLTNTLNPYCIKVEGGVVRLKIDKGFNQRLVIVSGV